MRSRLPVALLAGLALAGGLGACGSGDASGDVVPRTTPELRPPEATTLGDLRPGTPLNLEVDQVAKYVERLLAHRA